MPTRAELLQAHVEAVADKPITWGIDDCSPWCAGWLRRAAGIIVPIDLKYANREEAIALICEARGLPALWTRFLGAAGVFERIGERQFGDIGLVNTDTWGPIGAIFAADGIAVVRHEHGASFLRSRDDTIVKIWALPNHEDYQSR